MLRTLFSIFVFTYFSVLFLVFFVIISLVFLVTFPFDPYRKAPNFTLSIMARCMMKASPFWKMQFEGVDKFDPSKPTVFVSNHQSFLDMALIYHVPWKMKWVSKRSLTYIPVMGWLVWLTGHLTINRKSKTALKKLNNLVKPLKDLVPVMIFPEGTRTMDGKLKPFKNGPFLLAKEHGFALQPMVINGGYKAMPPGSKKLNPKVNFKLKVLDAIDPDSFDDMKSLKDHTRKIMEEQLNELRIT
ncbi:lysophospholipid acyltransferase family protein [Gracilimonas tropica]|uniref:lysophospholipid acyltransferase family protein n=1 Tax=Gracilimonas tropica TaxID=454600 RepID=UPI000377993B|nr:lysophospholipid acyltransferase family protein [Gracilimonas tropica]